jgi:hypothetical protein
LTSREQDEQSKRGVIYYRSADVVTRRLALLEGDRLIRYGEYIGLIQFPSNDNKVSLGFTSAWSHLPSEHIFTVSIEKGQVAQKASYAIDPVQMNLVVWGGEVRGGVEDGSTLRIYDIRRNLQIGKFRTTIGTRIGFVEVLPKTGYVIADVLSESGLTDSIIVASKSNGWRWQKLPVPREGI